MERCWAEPGSSGSRFSWCGSPLLHSAVAPIQKHQRRRPGGGGQIQKKKTTQTDRQSVTSRGGVSSLCISGRMLRPHPPKRRGVYKRRPTRGGQRGKSRGCSCAYTRRVVQEGRFKQKKTSRYRSTAAGSTGGFFTPLQKKHNTKTGRHHLSSRGEN